MEIVVFIVLGLAALAAALFVGVGALAVWPFTVGLAIIGWLIGGSSGAMVGVAIAGVIGLFAFQWLTALLLSSPTRRSQPQHPAGLRAEVT